MTMARFQTYLKDSDVVVTIHRGIDQIGGCITEISTKTSRVFVDFGQNLPGCTVLTTPEQDEAQVRDIFAQNVKQHQAVVYTHAHEDHVGLFDLIPCYVPQYIGVGGRELMLAKYGLLKIAHEPSATDIERLASVKTAALKARKGLYYTGGMMGRAMRIFTHREAKSSKGLFAFHFKYVGEDDPKLGEMQKKGFVLVTGASHLDFVKKMCQGLSSSEVLLIYSAWDGYYKDPLQVKQNPAYRNFREAFPNVVDIHTSGHASRECIKKVIDIVKPKEVICIHKEAGAEL